MSNALNSFKRKLTNLSSANPYLWIRRLKAYVFLDFAEIGKVRGEPTWGIINEVFSGKKSIPLCSMANHSDPDENSLSLKFASLLRKQKLTIQERGTNELHLAYPFVLGKWPDGTWVRTPLLLIPVSLVAGTKSWQLHPNLDGMRVNPSFLLAYSFHFKQELESSLFEKSLDFDSDDGLQFLTRLYNRLKESRLEIHFNQTLFSSSIQSFMDIRMDDLPVGYQPGMLRLQPEVVLGLFPQSDSILIPDFQFLEENNVDIDSIFLKEAENLGLISEKNILCPLPVDGSQEACIRQVKSGRSLVVQGPPGTGKSQLIANLMADAMGSGKSVLLVCQKKVALEVVRARLSESGFGDFVAIWADFKNDKSMLFGHLMKMIEGIEEMEKADSNLNTVVLERNFQQVCQTIDRIVQKLENWNENLLSSREAGISVLELYQTTKRPTESDFSFSKFTHLNLSDWMGCKEWIRQNWDVFLSTLGPRSPLKSRNNWVQFEIQRDEIPRILSQILENFNKILAEIQEVGFRFSEDFEGNLRESEKVALRIKNQLEVLRKSEIKLWEERPLADWLNPEIFKVHVDRMAAMKRLQEAELDWPFDFAITDEELKNWINRIQLRKSLPSSRLVVKMYSFFSGEVKWVYEKVEAFRLEGMPLDHLVNKLTQAREWLALATEIGFLEKPEFSKDSLRFISTQIAEWEREKEVFKEFIQSVKQFKKIWPDLYSWDGLEIGLNKVLSWNLKWKELENEWTVLFPASGNLNRIFGQIPLLIDSYKLNFEAVFKADRALANAPFLWNSLVKEAVSFPAFQELEKAEILERLENSWKNSWIFQIESNYPELMETDSQNWNEEVAILRKVILEKAEFVKQILTLRLRENTYKNLEYNRLGNRVTYRELYHKVSKKRMKPSLRQLWADHQPELSRLIPGWLATPESVSATWPMTTSFDLVIFDESSQCFAERGIPAAFRGKQLVIVGDDKQLPPHHLFSARWEEAEEDQFSGQDSLLDLAKQFLPQKMLTQHYRSDFPEMIAFSNQHFYSNRLESIPHSSAFQPRMPAIRFRKIEGSWKNQVNEEEAIFIAQEILSLYKADSKSSVGVITFNARQQEVVERVIESEFHKALVSLPESLFVKNIENVQGDERDHIYFSIGYARGENGKVVSQFGSLSISGGENRLNVAITRARKSIVLVSSIFPDELPVSENSPQGPKLLKRYLQFAYLVSETGSIPFSLEKQIGPIDRDWREGIPEEMRIEFPNADFAQREKGGGISLHYFDNGLMLREQSIKNYFGYKYLALTQKGYSIHYHFSRKKWQSSID